MLWRYKTLTLLGMHMKVEAAEKQLTKGEKADVDVSAASNELVRDEFEVER